MKLARTCVRAWTWLYTQGLPDVERYARRNEVDSDLWESESDPAGDHGALNILLRLLIGIPDDLGWRFEQAAVAGTRMQEGVALSGRAIGAALFICALWVIDADSSRRRERPAVLNQEIEGRMTRRAGDVLHPVGRRLPLLTAGLMATVGMSIAPPLEAQSRRDPTFEVASVRPNTSSNVGSRLDSQPGGRLTGTNVTAAMLIRFAYDLPDFQILGGPNWLSSDRFDVIAKAEGDAPVDQKRLMLRRLLTERFKLTAHTETRDLPIYALAMSRNDGRLGPQLRRTESDCSSVGLDDRRWSGVGPAEGAPACGFFGFAPGTRFSEGRGGLAFRGLTMAALAKALVPILRRSVADRTGLTGYFDGDFDFIAEFPIPPPPPGVPNPFDAPFASVFAVLPEQLGLKLESVRGPVEVLVIDNVERLTPE